MNFTYFLSIPLVSSSTELDEYGVKSLIVNGQKYVRDSETSKKEINDLYRRIRSIEKRMKKNAQSQSHT